MHRVRQLADIDTSKYISAICKEVGVDAVILDIEKVEPESMGKIQNVPGILKDLVGAKLIFMEPMGDGSESLAGLILYFMFPNGDQRAIEIDPAECESIDIQFYKLDKQN